MAAAVVGLWDSVSQPAPAPVVINPDDFFDKDLGPLTLESDFGTDAEAEGDEPSFVHDLY